MNSDEEMFTHVWRFVRGDEPASEFEAWVYGAKTLEARLGSDLYFEVISTDFSRPEAGEALRSTLAAFARSLPGPDCTCIRLRDMPVVDMGWFRAPEPAFEREREWSHEDVIRSFVELQSRGAPYWWLWLARCTACEQSWLVASEERQNDIFCLRRLDAGEVRSIELDGRWPTDFDRYETLLRIGLDRGRSVRYLDPENSGLDVTIADLARERPRIRVSELATLLNLDPQMASRLARRAAKEGGIEITFDAEP